MVRMASVMGILLLSVHMQHPCQLCEAVSETPQRRGRIDSIDKSQYPLDFHRHPVTLYDLSEFSGLFRHHRTGSGDCRYSCDGTCAITSWTVAQWVPSGRCGHL